MRKISKIELEKIQGGLNCFFTGLALPYSITWSMLNSSSWGGTVALLADAKRCWDDN